MTVRLLSFFRNTDTNVRSIMLLIFFIFASLYNSYLSCDDFSSEYDFPDFFKREAYFDPTALIFGPIRWILTFKSITFCAIKDLNSFSVYNSIQIPIEEVVQEYLNKFHNHYMLYSANYTDFNEVEFFRHSLIFLIRSVKNIFIFFINQNFDGAWFLKFGFLFLFTTIVSLFSLSYLGLYGVFILNIIPLFLFWASSLLFLEDIFFKKKFFFLNLGKWFVFNINQKINFELYVDYISISFIVLTLTIATFVYCYCFSYFRFEPNVERLLLFINLFVISMILLVCSGNFIVLFLGWELIGLTSFFLINFWSTRMGTLKAAFKAFVFNKFSDVSILMACILCYLLINDFSIVTFNNEIHFYINYYVNFIGLEISFIELISFLLLSAAFIKSAQFGTHIWLPDSMEAPVPASALIHSATLVSAGVFLLLRFSPLFELSTYVYVIIPVIGSFTAFFGGVCAAYQSDIKRILAYSTISHCGFLMVTFCTNVCEYTILYLYIHGFFKAAVFLCVGNVIRFSRNYQDFRRMGGFYKLLPLECFASFICLLNLSGLPFTLGFYIKHVILIGLPDYINFFVYLNVIGGALCGIIYSYRLFYYVFFDFKKAKKSIYITASRNILKSFFYSNTTLASNLAIIGLILTSYILSLYFLNICINNISNNSELVHFYWLNANAFEYNTPTYSLLFNLSYVNWFILYIIILCYLVKWRYFYKYSYILNKFYFYTNTLILLNIIYTLICL